MLHLVFLAEVKAGKLLRAEHSSLRAVEFLNDAPAVFGADKLQKPAFIELDDVVVDVPRCLVQLPGNLFGCEGFPPTAYA
ncbi:hypothetical protein ACFTAO_40740 [Paenibacillus rhizoplanae]